MAVNFVRKNFNGSSKDAILGANRELVRSGMPSGLGGEATLTIGFIAGEKLYVVNAGESPAICCKTHLYKIYTQDKGYLADCHRHLDMMMR